MRDRFEQNKIISEFRYSLNINTYMVNEKQSLKLARKKIRCNKIVDIMQLEKKLKCVLFDVQIFMLLLLLLFFYSSDP